MKVKKTKHTQELFDTMSTEDFFTNIKKLQKDAQNSNTTFYSNFDYVDLPSEDLETLLNRNKLENDKIILEKDQYYRFIMKNKTYYII